MFFGFPFNVLEISIFLSLFYILFTEKNLRQLKKLPFAIIVPTIFIITGIISSSFLSSNQMNGLGILKGWFLIPMLFSVALFVKIKNKKDLEETYLAIFLSGLTISLIAIVYLLLEILTYDNRLRAFYASPNYLAMAITPSVFFGLFFIFQKKLSWLYASSLMIILFSLYLTFSYGAWLAIIISLGLVYFFTAKKSRVKWILASSLVIFLYFIYLSQADSDKFKSALTLNERSSLSSRLTIWDVSFKLIYANPVFGIGAGNFQQTYLSMQKYYPPFLEWAVPHPHNIFLAFWLQAGLLGLIGFLSIIYILLKKLFLLLKNKKEAAYAAPLAAYFVYVLTHGLVDTTYWKNDLALIFWVIVILALKIDLLAKEN